MAQNSTQIISSAITDRGLSEKRPQNEDSYLEMPERGLYSVADGVGGAQAGDVASQMAMEMLAEAFNNYREGDIEDLMNEAITRANGAIFQMSKDLPQLSTMATTIVSLQISGNIATIGHVGDSRLYRLDSRGNLFRETQDHSVVEEEVRAGRMTPEQAENHPSKNVISRALGAERTVEIDMKTIMFEPNTTFLLCSDGITRHITDVEIRELLALPHPPVIICQEMKAICYERGAEDNLTAVIVRILGDEAEKDADIEESTIAAARQPVNQAETPSYLKEDHYEIPTQNLQAPPQNQENYETLQEIKMPVPEAPRVENDYAGTVENYSAPANTEQFTDKMQIAASAPETVVEKDERIYAVEETKAGGGFGKFLLFLLGLLLGGLLGAAGYYFYTENMVSKTAPPEITKTQSADVKYKTFEDARRSVDAEPQTYIKAQGNSPKDSADFYLLGRANLLVGNVPAAKEFLTKAKESLGEYKGDDKQMIANEIAFATSIVKNETSIKTLEAEKPTSSPIKTESKTNTNSVANQK